MSKILILCTRKPDQNTLTEDIKILSKKLEPDNIIFPLPKVIKSQKITVSIFNPHTSISLHGLSVCLGKLTNSSDNWWKPKSKFPDGSFALFRCDNKYIEILTDATASRTIWYYFDDDIFIASTSQRAIIYFLKSFEFNQSVIPWMLSTGTLGPGYSWDSRIKFLDISSSILLDYESWKLKVKQCNLEVSSEEKKEEEHEKALKYALYNSINNLNLDYSKWVLPLSGGYDSRCILLMTKKKKRLKCVTWGLSDSQYDKDNDAYIAKELTSLLDLRHQYFSIDKSNEPFEKVFSRFLTCGEGRIDHISGYMDGFEVWKTLFEKGIEGILRGDQPFSSVSVNSSLDVKRRAGLTLISDFENLKFLQEPGLPEQSFPRKFNRKSTESLIAWRNRLYLQFRAPFVWAALNDLKLSYVEVVNPLLTREIIMTARRLPDYLSDRKKIFKKIVDSISPPIEYATSQALDDSRNILRREDVVKFMLVELRNMKEYSIFPENLIQTILAEIEESLNKKNKSNKDYSSLFLKQKFKSLFNRLSRLFFRRVSTSNNNEKNLNIDFHLVAFRVCIINMMHKTLTADAATLSAKQKK